MAELKMGPDQAGTCKRVLRPEIEASVRLERGILPLSAVSVKGSPASIRIFAVYADQPAHEALLNAPHFRTYEALAGSMVLSLRFAGTEPVLLSARKSG